MGILEGDAPLTRATNSGNMVGGYTEMLTKKYGSKVNLFTMGKKHTHVDAFYDYYFEGVSDNLTHFTEQFDRFFKMMEGETKRQQKKDKGSIFKVLYDLAPQFFDFKVWKKFTGQARKPEVAALHQIRDLLIEVNDPTGKRGFKERFGQDPKSLANVILGVGFSAFKKRFGEEDTEQRKKTRKWHETITDEAKNVFNVVKHTVKELRSDIKSDYNVLSHSLENRVFEKDSFVRWQGQYQLEQHSDIGGGQDNSGTWSSADGQRVKEDIQILAIAATMDKKIKKSVSKEIARKKMEMSLQKQVVEQQKEQASISQEQVTIQKKEFTWQKFKEFRDRAKSKLKKGIGMSLSALIIIASIAFAVIGGLVGKLLFGKKGAIAGAITGLFLPFLMVTLAKLLFKGIWWVMKKVWKGISGLFTRMFTTVKAGIQAIFKGQGKMFFKGLFSGVGKGFLKAARVGGPVGIIISFLSDIIDSITYFRKGMVGEGIKTIFAGKKGTTTGGKIGATVLQAIKYGCVGFTVGGMIGALFAGVGAIPGTIIGTLLGIVIGTGIGMIRNDLVKPFFSAVGEFMRPKSRKTLKGQATETIATMIKFGVVGLVAGPGGAVLGIALGYIFGSIGADALAKSSFTSIAMDILFNPHKSSTTGTLSKHAKAAIRWGVFGMAFGPAGAILGSVLGFVDSKYGFGIGNKIMDMVKDYMGSGSGVENIKGTEENIEKFKQKQVGILKSYADTLSSEIFTQTF